VRLMPIKQAQAKWLNATADKGLRSLTLSTFKKDRSVSLEREGDGWVLVEKGFERRREPLPTGGAAKHLVKDAFKREFPHSARAYVAEVRSRA